MLLDKTKLVKRGFINIGCGGREGVAARECDIEGVVGKVTPAFKDSQPFLSKIVAIGINSRCHSISLVMYIFGAKFEEHCSNISGDICDSVLFKWNHLHIQCHQIPHLHNTKTWISFKQKNIFQKEKHRSSLL